MLSIFQLGFLGAGPLGSLDAGFVADLVGALPTLPILAAGICLTCVGLAWPLTGASRLEWPPPRGSR